MAKCNTFVTFSKNLGKTYPPNPCKQGAPEGQGRNEDSPLKGIDTSILVSVRVYNTRRNEDSPLKGIDTFYQMCQSF